MPAIRPTTLEPRDDDEFGGAAIALARCVGLIVWRYREPVAAEVLAIALAALFAPAFDRLDDDELERTMGGVVLLARALGLVEALPDGTFVATTNVAPPP